LGFQPLDFVPSSYDLMVRGKPLASLARPTTVEGLSLVTASADLADLEHDLVTRRTSLLALRKALTSAGETYRHVLLDCPPWPSAAAGGALAAAEQFLVPVVPQFLAAEGLDSLLDGAERQRFRLGLGAKPLGLVVSIADYRLKLARQQVGALRARHGTLVFALEVRSNVRLAEAPGHGQTIFQYDHSSTGARMFELLTDEYLLRCGDPDQLPLDLTGAAAPAPVAAPEPAEPDRREPQTTVH
jgi:chromosome partitioning protein